MSVNINNQIDKKLNLSFDQEEKILRDYAILNNVPIIGDEGLAFLENIIKLYKPQNILEIGSAIGYSAERMAKLGSNVYTIERDEVMYNRCIETIKTFNLEDKIHLFYKDALEAFDCVKDIKFDMLFIDAAKGQYKNFFEIYTPLLKKGGIVVCDNMSFHNLESEEVHSRSLRALLRKIDNFHNFLLENNNFDTTIFNIGDGMSISFKK